MASAESTESAEPAARDPKKPKASGDDEHEAIATPDSRDPRSNLRHVLASSPATVTAPSTAEHDKAPAAEPTPSKSTKDTSSTPHQRHPPSEINMTTTTRRNANGSVSSVYSGNKIPYLKKDDGQPLWRTDIQFLFLETVFKNDKRVFTSPSDGTKDHTFAEIFIDTMARSSKCSGILKDKLLNDHKAAVHMAMICLLVNIGRMNTTLNFFPEMRARVRTYHPIPSLQAHQSSQAYKQLQDGPRLKSILKGATEDVVQPNTITGIMEAQIPRTNPVNLIFVLSQYAPKITEMHFTHTGDFFDLFMKPTLSSKSRASAFLWLLWWYLESDFTHEAAKNNPFGSGQPAEPGSSEVPIKVPELIELTEEEADVENIDTAEEIAFGEAKTKEREAIIANDIANPPIVLKRGGKSPSRKHNRDDSPHSFTVDSARGSPSPNRSNALAMASGGRVADLAGSSPFSSARRVPRDSSRRGVGRGNYPRRPRDSSVRSQDVRGSESILNMTPADRRQSRDTNGLASSYRDYEDSPSFIGNAPYGTSKTGSSRRRPPTAHQQAIDANRRERVEYLLNQHMQAEQKAKLKERHRRGVVVDAWIKCRALPEGYDSESDEQAGRIGGLDEVITGKNDATGDVGNTAGELARAWRRVGKALDGIVVERVRRSKAVRLRGGGNALKNEYGGSIPGYGFGDEWILNRAAGFALPTGTEPLKLDGDGLDGGAPIKKKRPYSKRRATVSKPVAARDEFSQNGAHADKVKKRKVGTTGRTGRKRGGAVASIPGESVVPLDEYFENQTLESARAASSGRRRGSGVSGRGGRGSKARAGATSSTRKRRGVSTTEKSAPVIQDDTVAESLAAAADKEDGDVNMKDKDGSEVDKEDDTTMLDESTIVSRKTGAAKAGSLDEEEDNDGDEEISDSERSGEEHGGDEEVEEEDDEEDGVDDEDEEGGSGSGSEDGGEEENEEDGDADDYDELAMPDGPRRGARGGRGVGHRGGRGRSPHREWGQGHGRARDAAVDSDATEEDDPDELDVDIIDDDEDEDHDNTNYDDIGDDDATEPDELVDSGKTAPRRAGARRSGAGAGAGAGFGTSRDEEGEMDGKRTATSTQRSEAEDVIMVDV